MRGASFVERVIQRCHVTVPTATLRPGSTPSPTTVRTRQPTLHAKSTHLRMDGARHGSDDQQQHHSHPPRHRFPPNFRRSAAHAPPLPPHRKPTESSGGSPRKSGRNEEVPSTFSFFFFFLHSLATVAVEKSY
jgi:hypothetical protein